MPDSSPPLRSVFLSYAREDTEPARRIADALRGFGIEVWFDQSELRGGDAWDAKIKRQIRECTLFVAVISAHSQARGEGYFRREWKLATERTHDMAAGIPFLLPVVVDGTPEAGALVPEEFMRVQWTRLPGGIPTTPFVERVSRLLASPLAPAAETPAARVLPTAAPSAGRKAGMPAWAWGVVVIAAVAATVVIVRRPVPVAAKISPMVPPAAVPVSKPVDDKSIAVLPFANMSDDKENAFFTEGIQEDILTNLALAHELRVVSRTSVMQYRDTTKPIKQIAAELGVAYVLEGSVRRAGNKVRVTGQLIHAASDEHVWAKAYDRDLTDVFGIQSELSQAIATELKAALSPEERVMMDLRPTENAEAYDLYLQARRLKNVESDPKIQLLQKAVALDPNFARAWGELADALAYRVFDFTGVREENQQQAKEAIDRAIKIAPDDPEVVQSLGTYYYYAFRDYNRANEIYQKLLALRPNDAGVHNSLGLILRRQGRFAEALPYFRRATELDVADPVYLQNLISCFSQGRRYDELAAAWRKMAALQPESVQPGYEAALVSFRATGSRREVEAYLAHLSPEAAASPEGMTARLDWADSISDVPELTRLLREVDLSKLGTGLSAWEENIMFSRFLWKTGDRAGALRRLGSSMEEVQAKLKREPENPRLLFMRAVAEVVLGKRAEALADAERSMALIPEGVDAVDGPTFAALNAQVLDDVGELDQELAAYQRLFLEPGAADNLNVYAMKADKLTRLRDDPRYKALLDDPKNNAPLF